MQNTEKGLELRISLNGLEPEIWRSLHVPEDLPLPELHRAIQCAFGWEDRHLYQFSVPDGTERGRLLTDAASLPDLAPAGFEDASGVSLASVLQSDGSTISYEYDFGDSWLHTVSRVRRCLLPGGQIVCTGGARRGPVEDSGGIGGYAQLCEVLADPTSPAYEDLADWYAAVAAAAAVSGAAAGQTPAPFDAEAFDINQVNARLARFDLLRSAGPSTADELAAVVRPVRWLLRRATGQGLELTDSGYLKPAVVRAAMTELEWQDRWYGTFTRESQTLPVLELRMSCQEWKLLRKLKGRLVLTPLGRKAADDDLTLWTTLARQVALPGSAAEKMVNAVAITWMLEDTAPPGGLRYEVLAGLLNDAGFRMSGATPVGEADARSLYRSLHWKLQCLGLHAPPIRKLDTSGPLTTAGLKFLLEVQRLQQL